jgi:hypothetical protein
MLNTNDLQQISNLGITNERIQWQLSVFQKGIPYVNLVRAATVGDGVIQFNEKDIENYIDTYRKAGSASKIKFVPASGAASRMFKALFEFLDDTTPGNRPNAVITQFIGNIEKFAFYDDLREVLKRSGKDISQLSKAGDYRAIIRALLLEEGLNYGNLPKGLIKFHKYEKAAETPFEEHLYEAAQYASSTDEPVKLHFTVSPEHQKGFESLMKKTATSFEERFGVSYSIAFSIQKPSTDTLAVDMTNQPFRDSDGSLLFRPGGHGALIDNLDELEASIIFVKNIDNVVPERLVAPTITYKKALAGKLLEMRNRVYNFLEELDNKPLTADRGKEIFASIKLDLCYQPKSKPDFSNSAGTKKFLQEILNRPLRVCGVVKNLGEPGGGPFWAPNSKGDITLQIIESSQVDQKNPEQLGIFKSATHFNPVDLVCCPYDYKGQKFDLHKFVDVSTCFISQKSKDGKALKALELPGLWNGAMADWLTLFVEVPVETFNPVKTVNDLLRQQHQQ